MLIQTVSSPPDVTLAWSLQSALSLGLLAACGGIAWAFRRPAMRALAVVFLLTAGASVLIWLALAARELGLGQQGTVVFAALAFPLTPVLNTVVLVHLVRLIEGRVSNTLPPARDLVLAAAGAVAFTIALQWTTNTVRPGSTGMVAAFASVVSVVAYAALAAFGVRAQRRSSEHRAALTALWISFALMAVRSVTNVIVAVQTVAAGRRPDFDVTVTSIQVFLLVVIGVLQLIAVLEEERAQTLRRGEQVLQAEKSRAASQRLESLGRMAGAVAHDFNNLLSVISLSAQSALSTAPVDPARDEDLREIEKSASRGKELTKQLMAFARREPERVVKFDVSAQVAQVGGMLRRLMRDEVSLHVEESPRPEIVEMDPTAFEQVVMNLVINARDAISGTGRIDIRVARGDANGNAPEDEGTPRDFVMLSVTDSGRGIPADVLPHVFEPFFTTKTDGDGAGLGLATCDGIVRRAGGRIVVHTEVGRGTRFDVLLPTTL